MGILTIAFGLCVAANGVLIFLFGAPVWITFILITIYLLLGEYGGKRYKMKEEQSSDDYRDYSQRTVIQISNNFIVLDSLLTSYRVYYPDMKLNYGGTLQNFEFLAYTMTGNSATASNF